MGALDMPVAATLTPGALRGAGLGTHLTLGDFLGAVGG